MDESVKHRIIGSIVLIVMVLSLAPILFHLPAQQSDTRKFSDNIEPLTRENKLVEYEENWREPSAVATVNLDNENLATEEVEAQPILKNVKFNHPANPIEKVENKSTPAKVVLPTPVQPKVVQEKAVPSKSKAVKVVKQAAHKPKAVAVKKAKLVKKPVKKPHATAKPQITQGAWVVQLASFTQHKNALELQNRLRKKGYTAFIRESRSKGKTLYRVCVGPEINQNRSKKLAANIQKDIRLAGIVVHYSPSHH